MGTLVYVGTYTGKGGKGIYRFAFDAARGTLEPAGVTTGTIDPSFLAFHPAGTHLYAVNEMVPDPVGEVSAFQIDPGDGGLTLLGRLPTGGGHPCHVVVDGQARVLVATNYSSGSVAVFRLAADGSLAERTQLLQHEGASVDPKRQKGPHAHSAALDAAGRFAHVCDLGIDRVVRYRIDAARARLEPAPPAVALAPGSGPRHFAFAADGRFAYVINEIASTVTALAHDPAFGELRPLQTLSTLPGDWSGASTCADIHIHPNGRFLYGSNRGHDSIAVFARDPATGLLGGRGHVPTQGKSPRNFAIDPAGRYLLAANQNSASIVTFAIDPQTGGLTPTGAVADVPGPVCVKFLGQG
jgi:6-phosphogluconolactonase